MKSLPRPVKRLALLALLVAGVSIWRNRMIAANLASHPVPQGPATPPRPPRPDSK